MRRTSVQVRSSLKSWLLLDEISGSLRSSSLSYGEWCFFFQFVVRNMGDLFTARAWSMVSTLQMFTSSFSSLTRKSYHLVAGSECQPSKWKLERKQKKRGKNFFKKSLISWFSQLENLHPYHKEEHMNLSMRVQTERRASEHIRVLAMKHHRQDGLSATGIDSLEFWGRKFQTKGAGWLGVWWESPSSWMEFSHCLLSRWRGKQAL